MNSPFVRRRRLAAELRALRQDRRLTAEQLSRLLSISRMKISKLENAHIRPNLAEIMKILDCLELDGNQRDQIISVARDAAEKGWWDRFGDDMGSRQRLLADIESGARTIREYCQSTIPSVLQTRDYARYVNQVLMAEGDQSFVPDLALEARLRRQEQLLTSGSLRYEVVIDETAIRRVTAPQQIMRSQLRHLLDIAMRHPRVTLYVVPLTADCSGSLLPDSAFSLYTFHDPNDPAIAVAGTLCTDVVHIEPKDVARYSKRYECLQEAALSSAVSIGLLADIAYEPKSQDHESVEAGQFPCSGRGI